MVGLNRPALRFLDSYERQYQEAEEAAKLIREIVTEIVRHTSALVHVVTARAKTLESVRGKLRRKDYPDPDRQMTDLIGVRVITYYRDDVDRVVTRLQESLEVNSQESVDKRVQLGLRDFGYRSVHLIARLNPNQVRTPSYQILRDRWFEIQVRSILEHVWAEIEHEIVFKSGITYPEEIDRRFASLAGTLELLDNEFLALRDQRNALIDRYRLIYEQKKDKRKFFDVARLLGFLEASRPMGLSWRKAANDGAAFDAGLDISCVGALKAVGLGTPMSLRNVLKSSRFRYAVTTFAASQGIAPANVSHLAVVVLAVVVKDARMVQRHFSEIVFDSAIKQMVERRLTR